MWYLEAIQPLLQEKIRADERKDAGIFLESMFVFFSDRIKQIYVEQNKDPLNAELPLEFYLGIIEQLYTKYADNDAHTIGKREFSEFFYAVALLYLKKAIDILPLWNSDLAGFTYNNPKPDYYMSANELTALIFPNPKATHLIPSIVNRREIEVLCALEHKLEVDMDYVWHILERNVKKSPIPQEIYSLKPVQAESGFFKRNAVRIMAAAGFVLLFAVLSPLLFFTGGLAAIPIVSTVLPGISSFSFVVSAVAGACLSGLITATAVAGVKLIQSIISVIRTRPSATGSEQVSETSKRAKPKTDPVHAHLHRIATPDHSSCSFEDNIKPRSFLSADKTYHTSLSPASEEQEAQFVTRPRTV